MLLLPALTCHKQLISAKRITADTSDPNVFGETCFPHFCLELNVEIGQPISWYEMYQNMLQHSVHHSQQRSIAVFMVTRLWNTLQNESITPPCSDWPVGLFYEHKSLGFLFFYISQHLISDRRLFVAIRNNLTFALRHTVAKDFTQVAKTTNASWRSKATSGRVKSNSKK